MARPLLVALLVLAFGAACNTDQEAVADPPETTTAEGFPTVTLAPSTGFTDTERTPAPTAENCSTRSEAEFGGAFDDPANLVAGPFALVGAALPTSAGVLESHGGQKHPVLVRAGHKVTVRVPKGTQGHVSLGYGSLPQGNVGYTDGHAAVTFVACGPDEESGSSVGPGEPVTFWSGFVFASKPSCAPLDVYVDDEPEPYRLDTPLGEAC